MLPFMRQYMAIIDIRKIGAHVSEESIKPYFNWLMQWPQALDLKWLPAWRLALVLLHGTNKWYWLLFLASFCCIIWKDILKDTYRCNFPVFLKDCARTVSNTPQQRGMHMAAPTHKVQSILWPVLEDRCDRSVSEETDSTMAQITGLYDGSAKKLSMSVSWGNLLSLVAAFGQLGMSLMPSELTPLSHGKGKEEISSSSFYLRWDPISAFSPLCLWQLFFLPLKHGNAAKPRNTQADVHPAWEKEGQGMTFCFVSSLHHIISLGCWGLRNHRQSRRRNRAPKQARTFGGGVRWSWYWGWVSGWTCWLNDCMYMAAGREHFAFISSNFNTTLKHRERNTFYFPWSKTKRLVSWARHPKPRCMEQAVFL